MGEVTRNFPNPVEFGYVYMTADESGRLLYIGSTNDMPRRALEHQRRSGWWPLTRWMSCATVRTVEIARVFEARLIEDYAPAWNVRQPDRVQGVAALFDMPDDARLADMEAVFELQESYMRFASRRLSDYATAVVTFDVLRAGNSETVVQCARRLARA